MASVATKLMTADEFYDWAHRPENRERRFELEAGEVVETSRPGGRHGVVCSNANGLLWLYTRQQKKGYVLANDTDIVVERDPDTVRGPDISLFMESRKFDDIETKYVVRVPTLIVEVFSPNDRLNKMIKRINEFLARGVAMVWLLQPEERSVIVWRPGQPQVVLEAHEELTGFDVLPAFRCKVAEFFAMADE
jgi:Uma2 family endonuclease